MRNNKGENGAAVHADQHQVARSARNSPCASTSIVPRKSTAVPRRATAADQATAALEDVFKQTMPREMGFDYSGMSFQEQKARQGCPPSVIFGFSLLFVFLILAALYESWSLPFSVLLSTPVAVFGALRSFGCAAWCSDGFCRLTWSRSKTTSIRRSGWSCSLVWPPRTRF